MTTLKIRPGSSQPDAVQIDHPQTGEPIDIGPAVAGLTLRLKPGELPEVELDLEVLVRPIELEDPRITVPEETALALEAIGWRPPADNSESSGELLAEAARMLDSLDLGVESDGIGPLLRKIRRHLVEAAR